MRGEAVSDDRTAGGSERHRPDRPDGRKRDGVTLADGLHLDLPFDQADGGIRQNNLTNPGEAPDARHHLHRVPDQETIAPPGHFSRVDRAAEVSDRQVEPESHLLETRAEAASRPDRVPRFLELRQDVVVESIEHQTTATFLRTPPGYVPQNGLQRGRLPMIFFDQALVVDDVEGEEGNRLCRCLVVVGEALGTPRLEVLACGAATFRAPEHLPVVTPQSAFAASSAEVMAAVFPSALAAPAGLIQREGLYFLGYLQGGVSVGGTRMAIMQP